MKRITLGRVCAAMVAVSAVAAGLLFLHRRQEAQTAHEKNFFAMDTYFALTAYGENAKDGLEECALRVGELESLFSVTKEGSDIQRLNLWAASPSEGTDTGQPGVCVSEDTFRLVGSARKLCEETAGALDITIYPVLREWGFTTGEYRIVREERLAQLLKKVDYRKICLEEGTRKICLPKGMELDLGAVAKGYTGDCLKEILIKKGVSSALLDLGGNIQALGEKPDGSPWKIAVKDPFDSSGIIGVLEVRDKAVVTSGSYERFFVGEDGERYWHILDPKSGYPADSGLVSVTVVGENGMRCDGLSTALFVMGKERAVAFWRENPDFEMILVTKDGTVCFSEGLEESFVCGEDWKTEKISAEKR